MQPLREIDAAWLAADERHIGAVECIRRKGFEAITESPVGRV